MKPRALARAAAQVGRSLARPRRRCRVDEAGLSLVELMVASSLLAIVLAIAFWGLASMQRTEANSRYRTMALQSAQVTEDRLTKELREAVSFTSAGSNSATFTAYIGSTTATTTVTVALSPTGCTSACTLQETLTPSSGSPRTITDATDVVPGSGIFTWYPYTGSAFSTPVSSTNLASIASVAINLTDQENSTAPAVSLSTTVAVRSYDYANQIP